MTTPSSPNPISADQIRTEFGPSGASNSVSLGNYRVSQSVSGLSNLPLDTGVPQGTAAISFGNLRGKKINVVVDCTPVPSAVATTLTITDDLGGSVTVDFNNLATYSNFTTGKTYTIRSNKTITTNIYAVGGGGGTDTYGFLGRYGKGGQGGASQGRFTFVFGRTYKLIVGGGANGATAGYGGGGSGVIRGGGIVVGGGGGYTGLFVDSISQTNAILIAGGGGGGSGDPSNGGSGGGLTGGDASNAPTGRGGTGATQFSGGTGGSSVSGGTVGSSGSALQGGNGAGAGGGGGYFGGGGGVLFNSAAGADGGGGGGSGYINSTLISNGSFVATNSAGGGGPQTNGSFKIDFVSIGLNNDATKVNARSSYDANKSVAVIGGFKSKPNTVTNQKVWIHTNGPIGASSPASSRTFCTLFTGEWDATTDLRVDIGPKGSVMGAGGAGGNSGAGGDGSSAIGIIATNSVVVTNRGTVLPGGGGGGRGGQGGDGQFIDGKTTLGDSVGGPGGAGGLGQGYNQTNTAGADGGVSPGPGRVIGNVFVTGSGNGGNGGNGGTWGKVGDAGKTGVKGSRVRPNPGVTAGRPGFDGGSGGYDYVVSNDGIGVSGLPSVNVALNTIPT